MIIKVARFFQIILGVIPALWLVIFVGYLLSANYFQTAQNTFNYLSIIMLIVAFHSIWINLLLTAVLSIISRKFIYEKFSLITYIVGGVGLLVIISIDSGKYLEKLFD
jgi:hypothetical protein